MTEPHLPKKLDIQDKEWLIPYLKGLVSMLESVNSGRHVHERDNLRQSLKHCVELIEKGRDMSEWCNKNLISVATRTKKMYREWLSHQKSHPSNHEQHN